MSPDPQDPLDFDWLPDAAPRPPAESISSERFRQNFGEDLHQLLDLGTWRTARDLSREYEQIHARIQCAVEWESEQQRRVRNIVFPELSQAVGAPQGAGVHAVSLDDIRAVQDGLLFRGGVIGCDGTSQVCDTLPLTIYQIGVSLVSYGGDVGTWHQRLFRRDLEQSHGDPTEELLELLARRRVRGGLNQDDDLSELARRFFMTYAERAFLQRAEAVWRMGHGSPAPHELFIAAGNPDLMIRSVRVLRQLIEENQKFVFVASEPGNRMLLTLGQSLRPLEYAIIETLADRMDTFFEKRAFHLPVTTDDHWDGCRLTPEQWVCRFRDEVASHVVVGVFRASPLAPAHFFYAHEDHADLAAHIALADSVLNERTGFPQLITLADQTCKSLYGGGGLREMTDAAFAEAGVTDRYRSERDLRDR